MKHKLKKTVASVVITASMLSTVPALAAENFAAGLESLMPVSYQLTDLLDVEVKSVMNERTDGETNVGVVVKMKNNGRTPARVPEYELRITTSDGMEYTLQPSASNPKSILPMAKTELSYAAFLDRTDEVEIVDVHWTDVDYYVYPKTETLVKSIPVQGLVWKSNELKVSNPAAVLKWSDSVSLAPLNSPLIFKPAAINKESTTDGTVFVVQLLVTNPTDKRQTVPNFTLDGKGGDKAFAGKRVEKGTLILEPKEEKYIHFAIPTELDTVLDSLNVMTTETFTGPTGPINYQVGRLNVLIPSEKISESYPAYKIGEPLVFDKRSELIHPDMDVSIVEFFMNDSFDDGNKNVTVKYKLTNKSNRPLAVPSFQTDLISSDGYEYAGNRQTTTAPMVLPNSAATLSYSFTLPASETGEKLAVKVQDTKSAAPYKSTIASNALQLQPLEKDHFSVYPFDIKVTYWTIGTNYSLQTGGTYTYKAKFSLDMTRDENVQLDPGFSKLQFELYNSSDSLIGSGEAGFFGPKRLTNGENVINISGSTEQFDHPLTVRVYEVFNTQAGESKRLLGVFKQ